MASSIAFAALFGRGRRDDFVDEALRGFAKDAGGLAAGVEVDGTALRRVGFAGDAGGGECGGVGDGDVAVDAIEEGGVVAGDFVEVLTRGQDFIGPQSVIPVAAREPVAGRRGVGGGLDFGEHVGEGFDAGEVDVELGAAGAAEVGVGIVEAGEDEGAGGGGVEIVENGFGSGEARDVFGGADGENFAATDGDGFDDLRLVFRESFAGVDDAVEVDDIGSAGDRFGLGGRGGFGTFRRGARG